MSLSTATPKKTKKTKAAQEPKVITIIRTRRGVKSEHTGTVAEVTANFGYLLDCGKSYNPEINRNPRTGQELADALNDSVDETQKGSFNPEYYRLKTD